MKTTLKGGKCISSLVRTPTTLGKRILPVFVQSSREKLLITPKYFTRPPSVFPGLEQVQWPGKLVTHTIRECKGGALCELTTTEVIDIFIPGIS